MSDQKKYSLIFGDKTITVNKPNNYQDFIKNIENQLQITYNSQDYLIELKDDDDNLAEIKTQNEYDDFVTFNEGNQINGTITKKKQEMKKKPKEENSSQSNRIDNNQLTNMIEQLNEKLTSILAMMEENHKLLNSTQEQVKVLSSKVESMETSIKCIDDINTQISIISENTKSIKDIGATSSIINYFKKLNSNKKLNQNELNLSDENNNDEIPTQPIKTEIFWCFQVLTKDIEIDISEKEGKTIDLQLEYSGNIPIPQDTMIQPENKQTDLITFAPVKMNPIMSNSNIISFTLQIKFINEVNFKPKEEKLELLDIRVINSSINMNELVSVGVKIINKNSSSSFPNQQYDEFTRRLKELEEKEKKFKQMEEEKERKEREEEFNKKLRELEEREKKLKEMEEQKEEREKREKEERERKEREEREEKERKEREEKEKEERERKERKEREEREERERKERKEREEKEREERERKEREERERKEREEKERKEREEKEKANLTPDKIEEIVNQLDENYNVTSIFTREVIESSIKQAGGDYEKAIEILFN